MRTILDPSLLRDLPMIPEGHYPVRIEDGEWFHFSGIVYPGAPTDICMSVPEGTPDGHWPWLQDGPFAGTFHPIPAEARIAKIKRGD